MDVAMFRTLARSARRATAAAPGAGAVQRASGTSGSASSSGLVVPCVRGVGIHPVDASFVSVGRHWGTRHYANARGTRPKGVSEATRPLIANMIVERLPIVMPMPEDWELEYHSWSQERRAMFLQELPEDLVDPKGEFEEVGDPDELMLSAADRETDADRNGDVRTLKRKLDQFLFLVVQDAKTKQWGFPKQINDESSQMTMRQSAKQAMDSAIGSGVETYLVGNAPMGHFLESETDSNESEGTNFYMRAQWLEGDLTLTEKYADFKWLTKVRLPWFCLEL